MPEVHAILSASSSKRWLNCTPSARLEQNFPNESSVFAEEGTAAHALGEYKLRKYLHERVQRPTSEYENEEMEANTDIYAEFIISTVERIKENCPHPLVMVEERLDYSYLVPSGFGTGDCVIIADDTLYVMDYKNGKGVFVSCDHNPQMMLYALGAYHAYGYLYNIKQVSMTIIQPRLENISTYECSVEELLDWAETYVRPRAKLAFEGKGEQVPGDWCRFCRARTSCKACADEAMVLVKEEFLDLDEAHPLCVQCAKQGKYVRATVVDHIIPHRGDQKLFWDQNNWQALCKSCHDKKTLTEDINPTYTY